MYLRELERRSTRQAKDWVAFDEDLILEDIPLLEADACEDDCSQPHLRGPLISLH